MACSRNSPAPSREVPTSQEAHRMLIVALVRFGQLDEAHATAARFVEMRPDYRVNTTGRVASHLYSPEFQAEHRQALLTAGLPE
jgi:hypothetical protein